MQLQLTTATVAELTGASHRQIGHWAATGLVKPSVSAGKGKGNVRLYSFRDVIALKTVQQLRQANCPLQRIRKAVHHLQKHYPGESSEAVLASLILLTDGRRVFIEHEPDRIVEVMTGHMMLAVPLGRIIRETQQQLQTIPARYVEQVRVNGQPYHLDITYDVEDGGYVVQCRELPGALSQADTLDDAVANGKDAISLVLSVMKVATPRKGRHVARSG